MIVEKARRAKFVRAISKLAQDWLISRVGAESEPKIRMIHVGVSVPEPRQPNAIRKGPFEILCAANFEPVKGHIFLLNAIRLLVESGENVHCTLAGEGRLADFIHTSVHEMNLDQHVSMPGMLPHAELLKGLNDGLYDVVVLSSVTRQRREFEGIPISLVEALSAGVPCVAPKTGALPELIDESCGILVPERDPQALADAIKSLIRNPSLRLKLGEGGRNRALAGFDARNTASQMLDLFFDTPH